MTFPTEAELFKRRCALAMIDVAQVDREAMAVALIAQGYSVSRARQLVLDLADDDGALQMLARHRIDSINATLRDSDWFAGNVDADGNDLVTMTSDVFRQTVASAFSAGCYAVHFNHEEDRDPDFSEAASDYANSIDQIATA